MNTLASLTSQQLRRAADIKDEIEQLSGEVQRILCPTITRTSTVNHKTNGLPTKRVMSASARARIGAAQRARWAKLNGHSSVKLKTGRTMSSAAKAKIAKAAKARWAKAKAAGKNSL